MSAKRTGKRVVVRGRVDPCTGVAYLSDVYEMDDGTWRALADVDGTFCRVEVTVENKESGAMSEDEKTEVEGDGSIKDMASGLADFMTSFNDEHGELEQVNQLGRNDAPITVAEVKVQEAASYSRTPIGTFVAVRTVGDDKKTFLGVYLGDLSLPPMVSHSTKSQTLFVSSRGNPAMWVPDLNRVVRGYESWWKKITTATDLEQISDADIENVWYVKALKTLVKADLARAETADVGE